MSTDLTKPIQDYIMDKSIPPFSPEQQQAEDLKQWHRERFGKDQDHKIEKLDSYVLIGFDAAWKLQQEKIDIKQMEIDKGFKSALNALVDRIVRLENQVKEKELLIHGMQINLNESDAIIGGNTVWPVDFELRVEEYKTKRHIDCECVLCRRLKSRKAAK